MKCIELAAKNPVNKGELKIYNQFTEQFTVNELADKVKSAAGTRGIEVKIESVENPRVEMEEHYYNAKHTGLTDLGLEPNLMTEDVLIKLLDVVSHRKEMISTERAMPRVRWSKK